MGRHSKSRPRPRVAVGAMAFVAPAAAFVAAGGSAMTPVASDRPVPPEPVVAEAGLCCLEVVAMPAVYAAATYSVVTDASAVTELPAAASRWRVVDNRPVLLSAGVAPERNLQVKTILTARAISAAFPEIGSIGGFRADALRWHPDGLALDVMIPNPGSAEGIALGNRIVAFVYRNAERFGMQDAIWRGVYYTPTSATQAGMGHYDHVHITTTGGGYPSGSELYFR